MIFLSTFTQITKVTSDISIPSHSLKKSSKKITKAPGTYIPILERGSGWLQQDSIMCYYFIIN
jgi:hypothetical protein